MYQHCFPNYGRRPYLTDSMMRICHRVIYFGQN